MAKIAFIIFTILISTVSFVYSKEVKTSLPSKEYLSDRNIEVVSALSGSRIQLARRWDILLYQGFDHYIEDAKTREKDISSTIISRREHAFSDGWKFANFKNALKASISNDKDTHNAYLIISGSDKGDDTAFELSSPMIPVEAGKPFTLTFRCQLSKKLITHSGHKGKYETGIIWLASDNKKIYETPFSLLNEEGDYKDWSTMKIEVTSPENASKAMIRFGFDLPNLGPEDFVCFDDIRFATLSNKFEHEGEFISRPLRFEPCKLSFLPKADMPTGTAIRFQLRFAEDNNGIPGNWSSFTGSDGTPLSYYDLKGDDLRFFVNSDHKWLQYRAILHTSKPDATPVLHSVKINNSQGAPLTDNGWSGPDTTPPDIIWRSPTRIERADAPISFILCDNTGGLGVNSVEAFFDGERVELLRSESNESEYTLKTAGPIKPIDRSRELSTWRVENYQNALAVEQATDVITIRSKNKDDAYVDTAFKVQSPQIPVRENTQYILSFCVQHDLELNQLQHWGELSNGIRWKDFEGNDVGTPYKMGFTTGGKKWRRYAHTVRSPAGAVSAELCFGWDSPNLKRGDFFSVKAIRFDGPQPDANFLPNLHKVDVRATDLAGNTMQKTWYMLVKRLPEKNIVTLRDDGMTLVDNKPFFPIGIYAVQKSKVNGYNFNTAFKELKEAGFNTAHTYMKERNDDFKEFYSTAERYGMKVFVMTSAGHNSTDIDTVVHDAATEVDQPALLSWYLADDTSSYLSSKDLKNIHEIIMDIDPYHLTSQADAVGVENRYKGYGDSTDIFLPELYPVRTKGKNDIAEVIRDMKNIQEEFERVGSRRGIWAIVQDFKGWGWERYPTNEELRAMTYLSIIHGATGITYYTYGGWGNNFGAPYDKDVWNNLKKVVGEIAFLHDALAERNTTETCAFQIVKGATKDDLGYPAINTLLKVYQGASVSPPPLTPSHQGRGKTYPPPVPLTEGDKGGREMPGGNVELLHQGKHYLFAANSAQQSIRCQFKPETGNISAVSVLFEDRTLPVKDGVFVDDFKPYDVHVYQW